MTTKVKKPTRSGGLTPLLEGQKQQALMLDLTEERLAEMYQAQITAQRERVEKLAAALAANLESEGEKDAAWWRAYWHLDARYLHADTTLQRLEMVGHVLVCPNHPPAGLTAEEGEALSLRGRVTGEGALSWRRYCEVCEKDQQIAAIAGHLIRRWEAEGE